MSEIILESRLSDTEIHEGYNTQQIVIDRLISLWNDEPEESAKVFQDVAERLARYDNPKPPSITFNKTLGAFRFLVSRNGKNKTIASNKNIKVVEKKRNEWLRFNR